MEKSKTLNNLYIIFCSTAIISVLHSSNFRLNTLCWWGSNYKIGAAVDKIVLMYEDVYNPSDSLITFSVN